MATYVHNSDDLTPLMTSNTSPSPNVASASSEYSSIYAAWKAFNHLSDVDTTRWLTTIKPAWLKFDFGVGNSEVVVRYTISAEDSSSRMDQYPKTWTLQGSNNDSDWTVLDTQTNVTTWFAKEMRIYGFSNEIVYRYYKLNITENNGSTYLAIGEFELMGALAEEEDKHVNAIDVSDFKYTGKVYYHNVDFEIRINYQVKLILNETNFNFNLVQSDGFDFRLAERSNGSGVLRMWIADWDKDNKHAVLWFKIPYLSANFRSVFYAFWGATTVVENISSPERLNFLFYEEFKSEVLDPFKWTVVTTSSVSIYGYLFLSDSSFTTTTNPLSGQSNWIIEAGVYLVNDTSCDLSDRAHGFEFIGSENDFVINMMHNTRVEHNATSPGGSTYVNIDQTYGGLEFDSYQEHYIAYYEPEDRIYQRISNRASYDDIENKIDREVEGDTRISNVRLHGRQIASSTDGAYPSYINWFVIREYDNLNLANLDGSELYTQYENVEHQSFDYKEYTEDLTSIDYVHNSSFGGDPYKMSNNITSDTWYSDEDASLQDQIYATIYFDRKENLVSDGKLHYDSGHEKFYGASKMSDSDSDVYERDHWRAESTSAWAIISFGSDRPIVNVFGIKAMANDLDSCPNNYKFYGGLEPYHASFKLLHEGSFTKTAEWQSVTFINKNPYKYYKFEIIDAYGNDIKVQEWLMYGYVGTDKPKYISQLRLHPADFSGLEDNFPKQIWLEGSNDMLNWEEVMPLTNTYTPYISHNASYGKWQRYSFTNIKGYWHYRLVCVDNWGATDGRIIISEWEMCELEEESDIHRILAGSTNDIKQIWASDTCGFEDAYGLMYIGNEKLSIIQGSKLVEEKEISEFYDDINVI